MKKLLVALTICITFLSLNKEDKIIIPKEAIRFRVIASSNTENDQYIKRQVVKDLNTEIKNLSFKNNTLETTRMNIKESIPKVKTIVNNTLNRLNANNKFFVKYGMNYFPQKEYQGIVYEAGEYESLVITLGDGKGENFWCVLFPPLCLLDTKEKPENIEYKSFVKEIIDKYL